MKVYPDKLAAQTKSSLSPLYIVSGEETLLINEAADTIRQTARQQGYSEREVFHGDVPGFKWEEILQSINSLSLFAEKKLVEIRCSKKQLNDKDFLAYWDHPNPDSVVLIITEKIDKSTLNTKWYKQLDQHAALVQIWPLDGNQLHGWLQQRARHQGLQLDAQAIALLQQRIEGNLLAAAQELEKLYLLYGDQPISAEILHEAVSDSARYDVFKLVEVLLQGNSQQALVILQHLQEEGTAEFLILRTLTREIRTLLNTQLAIDNGQQAKSVLLKQGVWQQRQANYLRSLKRLTRQQLSELLQQVQTLDLAVMGLSKKNVNNELQSLCLKLAGG